MVGSKIGLRGVALVLVMFPGVTLPAESVCSVSPASRSNESIIDAYFPGYIGDTNQSVSVYRAAMGLSNPEIRATWPDGDWKSTEWVAALKKIDPQLAEGIQNYSYQCRYSYAVETLNKRIAELGANHQYIRQWIETQKVVFDRCALGGRYSSKSYVPPVFPAEVAYQSTRIKKLQYDDREYQQAADDYYQGQDKAQREFEAIASSTSVHRGAAMYMVALDKLQQATESADKDQLQAGIRMAEKILQDKSLSEMHEPAKQLIGYASYNNSDLEVRTRLLNDVVASLVMPAKRVRESKDATRAYGQALTDVQWFAGRSDPDWWLADSAGATSRERAVLNVAKNRRLLRWLLADASVRANLERSNWILKRQHPEESKAITAWVQANVGKSERLLWLPLRAAADLVPEDELWLQVDDLAEKVQRCSTGPEAAVLGRVFWHAVRTSILAGHVSEVAEKIRQYPFKKSAHTASAVTEAFAYLIVNGEVDQARWLRDQVVPLLGNATWKMETLLLVLAESKDQVAELLSRRYVSAGGLTQLISISAMEELAADPKIDADYRSALSRAAWGRTYALGVLPDTSLTTLMFETNAGIAELWGKWGLANGQGTKNDVLLAVLRTPRIGVLVNPHVSIAAAPGYDPASPQTIDVVSHSDNNWWCALNVEDAKDVVYSNMRIQLGLYSGFGVGNGHQSDEYDPMIESFIAQGWLGKHMVQNELVRLSRVASGARLLSERVIEWANQTQPGDGEAAEALYRAVVTTRYSCQRQGSHEEYSKAAYRLLHGKFKDSEWTTKTPYWYGCGHFRFNQQCKVSD